MSVALEITPATLEDAGTLRALLAEVSEWLIGCGLRQWPAEFPDEWFVPALEAGHTWLARRDRELVATITLQWDDEVVWGTRPSDAGYVHRLAVRRTAAAAGVGRELLEWAAEEVRAAGRTHVRLDCWRENPGLRSYYEAAGFEHRGDAEEWGWPVSRYERPVL